jgi:hypothetical protein
MVYVPPNLNKIHESRQKRFDENRLYFCNRENVLDDGLTINLIIDKNVIYNDLDLMGFRREFNVINMYFRMKSKYYLSLFLMYLLKKNGVSEENYSGKSKQQLYRMYLDL